MEIFVVEEAMVVIITMEVVSEVVAVEWIAIEGIGTTIGTTTDDNKAIISCGNNVHDRPITGDTSVKIVTEDTKTAFENF